MKYACIPRLREFNFTFDVIVYPTRFGEVSKHLWNISSISDMRFVLIPRTI